MAISITTTAELARTQGVNILVYGAAGSSAIHSHYLLG